MMLTAWWLLDSSEVDAPALAGRMEHGSLEHDGRRRTWHAYIPASMTVRPPLVLILHGSLGDGKSMLEATRHEFNILAEQEGFIAVYPDGFERHWNDCRASAAYSANRLDIDDVGFLAALVQEFTAKHGVDPLQVYATGLSNGGQMAYRLALETPDLVAAVAAIAANLPVEDNMDCEPSGEPVATLIINGTEDPVNPYSGGLVEIFGDSTRGHVFSAGETALYWADLAGYSDPGRKEVWADRVPDDGTTVESIIWSTSGAPPVALITVVGGGHTIPHTRYRMPRLLGRTSHEFDATRLIWVFFSGKDFPTQALVREERDQ
jgi:polyhydroxybutyrate depolymerase